MEFNFVPVILLLFISPLTLAHPPQVVLPAGQTLVSTLPYGTAGQQVLTSQPSVVQFVRQPNGQLTQVLGQPTTLQQLVAQQQGVIPTTQVVQQPGTVTQVLGQQGVTYVQTPQQPVITYDPLLGAQQQQLITEGVVPVGGVSSGVVNAGLLGYPGMQYVNGVPVYINGLNNGLQTVSPVVNQPVVHYPAIRQVAEEYPGLVQLDPMDAALQAKENEGQMHMEKYAWGRNALGVKKPSNVNVSVNDDNAADNIEKELRSEVPIFYTTAPSGYVTAGNGIVVNPQPAVTRPTRTNNPFLNQEGKRRKHFEHFEYY